MGLSASPAGAQEVYEATEAPEGWESQVQRSSSEPVLEGRAVPEQKGPVEPLGLVGPGDPIAIPDVYTTFEGETLTVSAPGLRANDYDPDGDAIIVSNFTPPANGSLTSVVTSGAFTYVPDAGFVGTDTFTYRLRESATNVFSEFVTVTIEVVGSNREPIAVADFYGTPQGTTLTVTAPGLRANDVDPDGDAFIVSNFTPPANGSLTSVVTSGAFTYVPDAGFTGTDTFTYRLRESATNVFSEFVTATIFVGIPPPPDPTCPSDLVIADFQTAPDAAEFVDLQNVGSTPIDFAAVDCVLGGFTAASYLELPPSGTLAAGATLRFGASGSGADVAFPDGSLRDAYAALALLDRASLPIGTSIPAIQADLVTSLVYLTGGTVYGFFHVDPAHAQAYCTNFAGRLHPYGQGQCAASRDGARPEALSFAEMVAAALDERAAAEVAALPTVFALGAAYPNPVSRAATVTVELPEAAAVRVVVYDVLGRAVAVLVDGELEAGRHAAHLDASALAAGTYVVRMTAGGFAQSRRLTVVR